MLYPNTDLTTWTEMYQIQPLTKECPCCGKNFETTIPIALKGYRGLQTPLHECGDEGVVSIFVPYDNVEKDEWDSLLFS